MGPDGPTYQVGDDYGGDSVPVDQEWGVRWGRSEGDG